MYFVRILYDIVSGGLDEDTGCPLVLVPMHIHHRLDSSGKKSYVPVNWKQ